MKVQFKNLVDLKDKHESFKNPNYSYSVSGRWVGTRMEMIKYLQFYYIYLNISQIQSVFGSTTEYSDFYGGRVYEAEKSLTQPQLDTLYSKNINLALTLTNHFFSKELFDKNLPFLEKHHRQGNVVICTSDELAKLIRTNFPLYKLRASIIKNLNTIKKIKKAYDLYDDVVIPMDMNDDDEFLESLPQKERLMLFANAACAYSCPARICYPGISKVNQAKAEIVRCKKREIGLYEYAYYFFDVDKFYNMGFSNFKLIPASLFEGFPKKNS
jgi:hypothetical protein